LKFPYSKNQYSDIEKFTIELKVIDSESFKIIGLPKIPSPSLKEKDLIATKKKNNIFELNFSCGGRLYLNDDSVEIVFFGSGVPVLTGYYGILIQKPLDE
jgi:hypothetical protein